VERNRIETERRGKREVQGEAHHAVHPRRMEQVERPNRQESSELHLLTVIYPPACPPLQFNTLKSILFIFDHKYTDGASP
jgi:hypothetical protein